MTNIRRYFQPGDISFLTHVTYNRIPILIEYFDLLWNPIEMHQQHGSFDLMAWVVLPDHFHVLISARDEDISNLMRKIKLSFSTNYRKIIGRRQMRIWQYRFWDHIIRNQEDLNQHIDYIHYNPAKHGLVSDPGHWRYSSFQDYKKQGAYEPGWGAKETGFDGEYGE